MKQVNNNNNNKQQNEENQIKCACVCVYVLLNNQSTNAWITIFDPKKEQHRKLQPAEKFDQNARSNNKKKRFMYIYVHEEEDKLKLKKKYKENGCVCDMRAQKSGKKSWKGRAEKISMETPSSIENEKKKALRLRAKWYENTDEERSQTGKEVEVKSESSRKKAVNKAPANNDTNETKYDNILGAEINV